MQIPDFLKACEGKGWELAEGDHEGKPGYFVHAPFMGDEVVHCSIEGIEGNSWGAISRFVVNGRDVKVITRICGYYSRVSNWNKSKIGELRDRHAGNYSVREAPPSSTPPSPVSK